MHMGGFNVTPSNFIGVLIWVINNAVRVISYSFKSPQVIKLLEFLENVSHNPYHANEWFLHHELEPYVMVLIFSLISFDTSPAIKSLCVAAIEAFLLEFSFITSSLVLLIKLKILSSVVLVFLLNSCTALYPS